MWSGRISVSGEAGWGGRNPHSDPPEQPKRAGIPSHRGPGDVSLAQEGGWRMIVRNGKVEIGTSGTDPWRYDGRGRLNLRRVSLRPPVAGWNGVR